MHFSRVVLDLGDEENPRRDLSRLPLFGASFSFLDAPLHPAAVRLAFNGTNVETPRRRSHFSSRERSSGSFWASACQFHNGLAPGRDKFVLREFLSSNGLLLNARGASTNNCDDLRVSVSWWVVEATMYSVWDRWLWSSVFERGFFWYLVRI